MSGMDRQVSPGPLPYDGRHAEATDDAAASDASVEVRR